MAQRSIHECASLYAIHIDDRAEEDKRSVCDYDWHIREGAQGKREVLKPTDVTYISPTMDPTLTIVPDLRFAIMGATALHTRKIANTLVSKTRFASSMDCSTIGPDRHKYE